MPALFRQMRSLAALALMLASTAFAGEVRTSAWPVTTREMPATLQVGGRAGSIQYDSGNPTADEQSVLEMINRARANPDAEGTRLGIDIREGLTGQEAALVMPHPPLAMNRNLLTCARMHSQDMHVRNYFDHDDPDGNGPGERITAQGYPWSAYGENIAAGSAHSQQALEDLLMVDLNYPGRGHRKNLLSIFSGFDFREIGVGAFHAATANGMGLRDFQTHNFGLQNLGPFILGVVYNDLNSNNFYDPGEGLQNVNVSTNTGTYYAVTGVAGGYALPVSAGTYTITATGGSLPGSIIKVVTVNSSNVKTDFKMNESNSTPQTITFNSISNKTFGAAPFTVTATASSGLPVSFSIFSGPAAVSGNTVTLFGAGNVTVRASQAGDNNFAPATPVDRSFSVAKANQTLTFPAIGDMVFSGQTFPANATTSSGLAPVLTVTSGNATVSNGFITITGVGSITIRASQPGDSNYNAAAGVDRTFNVTRGTQTIDFPAIADKYLDQSPLTVIATASSGLPVAIIVVFGPASLNGNQLILTGGGAVTLRASQAGDTGYFPAADVERTFNVIASYHPEFTSGPTATPSAAYLGQTITFSAAFTDLDGNSVTLTWNFGDGNVAVGASVTHKFTAAGTFNVQASLFDGSLTTVQTIPVVITNAVTAPVTSGSIKFNFVVQKKDSFTITGTIPLSRGIVLKNTKVSIGVEEFSAKDLTLDAKLTAVLAKTVTFKITAKTDSGGAIADQNAKYSLAIKGETLFDKVKSAGFVNDTVKGVTVPLAATFEVGGRFYRAPKNYSYTAKLNKTGSGKSIKEP